MDQGQHITVLNAHQVAALQQQQQLQQLQAQIQQQQQPLQQQALFQHQLQQAGFQIQYQQPTIHGLPLARQPLTVHPQLIQLRPNINVLAPQTQFLVNNNGATPFYRILPQ
jgi:hypothetical protein